MCGEHWTSWWRNATCLGSSPHVRGTLGSRLGYLWSTGIIPACAGNTPTVADSRSHGRDHPRMCGEHPRSRVQDARFSGSSPHVRGTPMTLRGRVRLRRDHPRMCGEHRIEQQRREHDRGSSPHVRGTRPRGASGRDEDGIIPACAGNTS